MQRLGIFIFYNKHGLVDQYVNFLLKEVMSNVNRLIIICNCKLTNHDKSVLLKFTNEIVIRDNIGFDAGAWQFAILKIIGKDELLKYNELLLLNDTFFGPLYPLSEVFNEMEKYRAYDFWGITEHGALLGTNITAHIQTYFVVVREKMLHSTSFFSYWENMQISNDIKKVIINNEVYFTKYFETNGFKKGVFCDTSNLKSLNYYVVYPYMLLKKYRCPFLKKKALILNAKDREAMKGVCTIKERYKALQYVALYTKYPIIYIFKNIWATYKLIDIILCLGLFFPAYWKKLLDLQKNNKQM